MDNTQKLAWAAGLIDGDGTMGLHKVIAKEKTPTPRWYPEVGICCSNIETGRYLVQLLSGGCFPEKKHTGVYHYRADSGYAAQVVGLVEPYLFTKREQAQAILQAMRIRSSERGDACLSIREMKRGVGNENLALSGSVNDHSVAWLAGLFDADGCVCIYSTPRAGGYRLSVAINMVHQVSVYRVLAITGLGGVRCALSKKGYRPLWNWQIGNRDAESFLKLIRPHAITKVEQIDLALEFRNLPKGNAWHAPTPEMLAERGRISNALKALKRQ